MFNQVVKFVQQYHMIQKGDRIVVGVSGGADSMCLLRILMELQETYRLDLFVVHVNHGLRGEEALRDQTFVERFCQTAGVPFACYTEDVSGYSRLHHCSLEEAGRTLRYEAFEREYKLHECNKIAIAHNKNDLAETVLFHLVRGTGLKGLGGMEPVRERYIRPLLAVTRTEIEAYLKQEGLDYCTDSTNLETDFTRNKVRLQVLPLLAEVNSQAVAHIAGASAQAREVEAFLEKETNNLFHKIVSSENGLYSVNIEVLLSEEPVLVKRVLRQMIGKAANRLKDIEEVHVQSVYELLGKGVGKQVDLPYQLLARCDYRSLVIGKKDSIEERLSADTIDSLPMALDVPGTYLINEAGIQIDLSTMEYKKNMDIPKKKYTKWFDYDTIKNTIFLRTRRPGDFMQINIDGGTKSLKDIFINDKIPREERDNIPLLCDGEHVMWITGNRISEAYKVTEQSKRILVVNITEVKYVR